MKEKSTARICVPVCVKRVGDIAPAIARAEEYADFIEVRLDCLSESDFDPVTRDLAAARFWSRCPIVFTLRPAEQSGLRELDKATRFGFWISNDLRLLRESPNYADFEIDIAFAMKSAQPYMSVPDWKRVICSFHDVVGVPSGLEEIYAQMASTRARILKIAVQADDITDCIPVLRLLERARRDGREMIAIAMGEAGLLTRILGPSRGAFLTYGSLDNAEATAPGQISAAELRDLYRIRNIDEQTEIMGLVGEHVMHSVSPHMHNHAFAASGLNAVYIPFEVRALDNFVRRMVHPRTRELEWNLRGLSITAPHKLAIMQYLDWIDPIAVEIGAVNTVVISDEGIYGYNTDALAILAPLDGQIELDGARVAVIGAGGAARSLLWSLRKAGARVTVFARDVERGVLTAGQFGAECSALADADFDGFEIVINTTPLGTRGLSEDESPAIGSQLRGVRIAYDLVYNPIETRFMRQARAAGCECIGGFQMLVTQAAEQFKLWTGRDAPLEVMSDAALKALISNF